MNIVESCFRRHQPGDTAVTHASEWNLDLRTMTFAELKSMTYLVARRIIESFPASRTTDGDAAASAPAAAAAAVSPIAICMPMTPASVAVYLGIIAAGRTVVHIPDSFSSNEIEIRLSLAACRIVFTQDVILRNDKYIHLCARVARCASAQTLIVLPENEECVHEDVQKHLRRGDGCSGSGPAAAGAGVADTAGPAAAAEAKFILWHEFLRPNGGEEEGTSASSFSPVSVSASHVCSILFSSGTTGVPKGVPWTMAAAVKCVSDGFLHQDIHPSDVTCWPTGLGW